jgi:tetratricopeptide (TPR) repeat protein
MRIVLHDRVVDLDNGHVVGGAQLTQLECAVVRLLKEHAGQTVSRDRLLVEVWGYPKPVATRCVDTAVRRIRRKLESDTAAPRHLLTLPGEGYRWWDAGIEPLSLEDRCCGRQAWSEQLAWAEHTFGRTLKPHDPEAGLSATIRKAFEEEVEQLDENSRKLLDLLSLAKSGWTPDELSQHADPAGLRSLVVQRWVVVQEERARLDALWWPVRRKGLGARALAAELWEQRLRSQGSVDIREMSPMFKWSEVPPERAAAILILAEGDHNPPGLAHHFVQACATVLENKPPVGVRCRIRLVRAGALLAMGLVGEARRDAEACRAAALRHAPEILGEATARSAVLAHAAGDHESALVRYPEAIALTHGTQFELSITLMTDHASLLWERGDPISALQICREAHAAAVREGLPGPRVHAERGLARVLLALGHHTEAISRLERLYETALPERPVHAIVVAIWLGFAHLDLERLDEGEAWFERAMGHATEVGDRPREAMVHGALGCLAALRGAWEEANASQLRCLAAWEDVQMINRTLIPRCWVAVGEHMLGRTELGSRMLQTARDLHTPTASSLDTSVLALACKALSTDGPPVPEAAQWYAFARVARRAWGLELP